MSPNDADGMANSVDPDQTAPLGAVWSGSALFAQAYLSENLGSLRYDGYMEDIQIFVMIMTFISSSEVKKYVFHEWQIYEWNIIIFTSQGYIHDKNLNFSFYYIQTKKLSV